MTKRVVAYLRVSTDGQVEKYGLDAQETDIRVYCAKNDMEILEVMREEGVSGAKEDRPVFNSILYGEVANPPIEAVVVAKNDRVARDINIYYYYKMLLKKKNIELISVAEDFGGFGAFASVLEVFTMCVAEMERENITKRTLSGRRMKAKEGGYAGGRPPYGYTSVEGKLVINEKEAECVKRVFLLRECGKTLHEIAELVNEAGYVTQKGKEFSFGTIQNILKNENFYRGRLKYGEEYEGNHPRIL